MSQDDSFEQSLDSIHRKLLSSKATLRKEGLKVLNLLLDNNDFHLVLDQNTFVTGPSAKLKVGTWPGLCAVFVEYAANEMSASVGKKKGPEVAIPKTLRHLVQLADDDRRTGRKGLLGRKAGKVFVHVKDIIKQATLASSIGQEYSTLLRTNLLPVQQYCNAVACETFEELLEIYMAKLEEQIDRSEDTFRHVSSMLLLLQHFPGDMQPDFQQDMITFFASCLPILNQLREDSRISTAFVMSLNMFLLRHGLDISSRSLEIQRALQPFVLRCWRVSRDAKLKDAFVICLSIQVKLRGLQDMHGAASDILEVLDKDIGQASFRWGQEAKHGDIVLSRPADSLLQLTAAIYSITVWQDSGAAVSTKNADVHLDKRLRTASRLAGLHDRVVEAPLQWAPVLIMLIQNASHHLPHPAYTNWLQAASKDTFEDGAEPGILLWRLRLLHQLAVAWPAALTASEVDQNTTSIDVAQLESAWKATWDNVLTWLSSTTSKAAIQECAVALLSAMASRALSPNLHLRSHQFWSIPVLQLQPVTRPTMALICAAFAGGASASGAEKSLQQQLLQKVLTSSASDAPPQLIVQAVLVLSSGPVHHLPQSDWTPSSWLQEGEDGTSLQKQLDALARGQEWMARLADQAHSQHQQAQANTAAAAWATALSGMSPEAARPAQQVAGELLRQQLQLLTVDSQEAELALLVELVRVCTVTLGLMTALCGGPAESSTTCLPQGTVAEALQLALERISSLITGLCEAGKSLRTSELHALELLVEGLHLYDERNQAENLCSALLYCAANLERIFNDADNVAQASLLSSVQQTAAPGVATQSVQASNVAVSMFDDDLDLGTPSVVAGSKRPPSAGPASASLAATCRINCLTLITTLGKLDPSTSAAVVTDLLHGCRSSPIQPTTELVHQLIQSLCTLVAVPGGHSHTKQAIAFLAAEEDGLLAHKRFQRDEVLLVVQQLAVLAKAFLARNGKKQPAVQWPVEVEEDLEGLMNVLDDVLSIIAAAESKDSDCTTWQLRVQLASAILDLMMIDTQGFGEELLTRCLNIVSGLLADDLYFARRQGGHLATVLYRKWARPQSVFDDLKPKLSLQSLTSNSRSAEHMETAVLMLGETAAACGMLEREAVFLLCGHAAKQPSDRALVQTALDMLAERLNYPSRSSLMNYHMQTLFFDWCSNGYSLQQFLAIQSLVAVDERGAREERALIAAYLRDLVPVLLLHQSEEQLQEVASLVGMDTKAVLQKCMDSVFGSALPYEHTSDAELKALAHAVTNGGIIQKHFSDDDRNRLYAQKMVNTFGYILLTASDEAAPARPFFPISAVVAAILCIPGQSPHKNKHILFSQVLTGDAIATLLLTCHQHLQRAKHPRHGLQALAPLKALLSLLGEEAHVPSTFRYIINILLQQLNTRDMWADCCQLLQTLLDKMLAQQSTLEVVGAQLQHILASILASLQDSMVSLRQPLPSLTAARVQGTGAGDDVGAEHPLVKLILRLTVEAPAGLHVYLRDVEPLLPLPALNAACRLHEQLRKDLSLAEEVTHFAGQAKSMTSALRHRSLSALIAALPARKHQLFQGSPNSQPTHFLPQAEEAVWKLVWLSGEKQDSALAAFAGELLALAGPLDHSAIAFKPACAPRPSQAPAPNHSGTPQDSAAARGANQTGATLTTVMVAALQLMADYLVDPDVRTIRSVQFTLRHLLSSERGREALSQLDVVTQSYLQVYKKDAATSYRPSNKDASDPKWSVHGNAKLFSLESQSYDVWVRNLAYALLLLVQEPTLSMCQHMIVRKAELAELMLPHILADIACHSTDSSLMPAVSTQLASNLLSPSTAKAMHIKATQLILTCLDHLRNMHVDAVLGLDPGRAVRNSGAATQGRSRSTRQASQGDGVGSPVQWQKRYWLDIDYLLVAAAALRCSAYFTALLYVEHWVEDEYGRLTLTDAPQDHKSSRAAADELLLDIYSSMNEPDGIYAVARGHSMVSQLKLYEHESSWDKALTGYDLLCRRAPPASTPLAPPLAQPGPGTAVSGGSSSHWQQGLLTALQQLGCRHLIEAYWQGQPASLSTGDGRSGEMRYESAWRMGQWRSASDQSDTLPGRPVGTNEALHGCLKAVSDGDRERCRSLLFEARQECIRSLASVSTESVSSVNPAILQLQQLQCVQEAWTFRWPTLSLASPPSPGLAVTVTSTAADGSLQLANLQAVWRSREAAMGAGDKYELREPLLALRKGVCEALGQPEQAAHTLHEAAVAARQAGHLTHAMAAAHELTTTHSITSASHPASQGYTEGSLAWSVEQAKLLWAQGQQAVAVRMSKSLLEVARHNNDGNVVAYARLLSLTGKWLAETRFESSSAILASMAEAVDALVTSSNDTGQVACRVMYRLAHHADMLYAGIQAQKQSPEWNTAQAVIKQKRQQVSLLEQQLQLRKQRGEVKKNAAGEVVDRESRLLVHQMNTMMRPIEFDEEESNALQDSEAKYLILALTNYHRCLMAGGRYDLQVVFRLFQLWFTLGADRKVNEQVAESFRDIPSHKLLSLVYQIASRMSAAKSGPHHESGFQATLLTLLQRLTMDHPYHTLYQLFALKNGNRGKDGREVKAGDVVGGMTVTVDRDKVSAAYDLLRLVASKPARKSVVEQVNQLIEAYIHLAALPASSDGGPMPFPSGLRRKNRDLSLVPVVSAPVEVDPSCRYDNLPHFTHFGDSISFVGGVNKPKLIQCFDSAGRCHRQLVKSGMDDMRQDAVMQQFFALINNVLQESPDTQKRKLRIVTYKVVPFSPASGLLEWVEDTIPVHEYLTGKDRQGGAHRRYTKPGEMTFTHCMQAMHKAKPGQLRQTFDDVTAHFSPVLHHFFLETFRHPAHWFERRLQYTRSVAVNSMAGYIIGLGDRHSHNILLDRKTAEVVHIDLGVAFEQGRFLNTPELVPFRLTSNIVDGMGATGVEGVMRSCCEKTMGVLRQNKESLLTIIEVFIHDPLYKWALTPLGAQQRQKDFLIGGGNSNPEEGAGGPQPTPAGMAPDAVGSTDTTIANADAERALLRLKQKLAGLEGGQGESRGVKGQVQQLLQDAQSADKLCKMYVGWSAWL